VIERNRSSPSAQSVRPDLVMFDAKTTKNVVRVGLGERGKIKFGVSP